MSDPLPEAPPPAPTPWSGATAGPAVPAGRRIARVALALPFGWWLAYLRYLWVRKGHGEVEPVPALVLTGVVLLVWAFFPGPRLAAALALIGIGVAFFVKPWVNPPAGFGWSSETALNYSMPGVGLLVVGVLLVVTLSRGRLREELARSRAVGPAAAVLLIGLGAGWWFHRGPTGMEAVARYREPYAALRAQVRDLSSRLPGSDAPAAPKLDPAPVFVHQDRAHSNAELVHFDELRAPGETPDLDLYLSGELASGLEMTAGDFRAPLGLHWSVGEEIARRLERGCATRYLGIYRGRRGRGRLDVWLVDLSQRPGKVVARSVWEGEIDWSSAREAVEGIAEVWATGPLERE